MRHPRQNNPSTTGGPAPAAPSRLARALLIAGLAMASFIIAVSLIAKSEQNGASSGALTFGHDFLPSYVAGRLVFSGRARELYDPPVIHSEESRVKRDANLAIDLDPIDPKTAHRQYPWLNPPFFALAFVPFAHLGYRTAALLFLITDGMLLALSLVLLCRQLPAGQPRANWTHWATLVLLVCTSMPFLQALGHLQNTFLSLSVLCLAVTLALNGRPTLAGAVAGLLMFKPQLAVLVAMALAVRDWHALLGLAFTGCGLLLLNLIALPGTLHDYLHKLPPILHDMQTAHPYAWGRHCTLLSFWRLLIQGHSVGPTTPLVQVLWLSSLALVASALCLTLYRLRNRRSHDSQVQTLMAALLCMPLLMPYFMDYDLLLLAAPATLFARRWITASNHDLLDGAQLWLWIALFITIDLNTGISAMTRFIPVVPVLVALASATLAGAGRVERGRDNSLGDESTPTFAEAA